MSSSWDQRRRNLFGHPLAVVGDTILSLCFVAPLVVGYWRGTWELLNLFLYKSEPITSCWISLAFGCSTLCLATWLQNGLQSIIVQQSGCIFFILSRLYTIIYCLANVNHWRGVWDTLDLYTGVGWASASWSLGIGISGLILLRAFRNILAPPALIAVDGPEEYFTYPTMFRTYDSKDCHMKILDGIFSVTIVGSLVVLVWRGSFLYLDILMFPSNNSYSAFGSTALGYSTALFAFTLQSPLADFCTKVKGFWRISIMNLYTAILYVGSVNIWRGLWMLYDLYLLPGNTELSCLITHAAGLLILGMGYCSHSILVRGVYLDAEESGADAAVLPYFYIRYFIQRRQKENAMATKKASELQQRKAEGGRVENGWLPDEESMLNPTASDPAVDHRWMRDTTIEKESSI